MTKFLEILRIVSMIPSIIAAVESVIGKGHGKSKEKAVLDQVNTAILTSEWIINRDIVDNKKFHRGLKKVIEGVVDVLNSSVWHNPAPPKP
jgi:VIT1/CCC1 family predicted Fe2+/Mn2+ transporter